ncbi:sensor histidine kinase [Mycetocola tolaasinivorans]|nr:histidine kinase [Mycetocola tolaasinivorans]
MTNTVKWARRVVPLLLAALFVTMWILGEQNRVNWGEPAAAFAFLLPLFLVGGALATVLIWPWVSLVLVGCVVLEQAFIPDHRFTSNSWPIYFGLLVVAAVLGTTRQRELRRYSLVTFAVAGIVISITNFRSGAFASMSGYVAVGASVLGVAAWAIGNTMRADRDRVRSEQQRGAVENDLRRAEIELIVGNERERIAQDVHDIMAHSLSVIVAQADGARYLLENKPERAGAALADISHSARESLIEVRRLLDSLDTELVGHSQPGIDDLPELTERMRTAGLWVEAAVFGEPAELSVGQSLAVYRIVQEALTNALKHGGRSARAQIVYDWRGPGLALIVSSHGDVVEIPEGEAREPGRGIRGMRERARVAGGWLSAEADDAEPGRFVVTASIPVTGEERVGMDVAEVHA